MSDAATPSPRSARRLRLGLAAVVVATALLRLRLLDVPLERDEGGYAYNAQLLLHGVPPFVEAYDVKMPGLYALYALFLTAFGQTARAVHLGLLLVNALTVVAVFALGRRLISPAAGLVAAALFGLMSVSQAVAGFAANTEILLLAPAMGGLALLLRAGDSPRLATPFGSGLLLGLALVLKHHAVFFVAFAGLIVLTGLDAPSTRTPWRRRAARGAVLGLGAALPFAVQSAILAACGSFASYWFWLVDYPRLYTTPRPLGSGLVLLRDRLAAMAGSLAPLGGLAALGLTACGWHPPLRKSAAFLGLFGLISFAAVCPALLFMDHYMVLLLPAAALLGAAGVEALSSVPLRTARPRAGTLARAGALGLAGACAAWMIVQERAYLFVHPPQRVLRESFGANPFPESVDLGRYIAERTAPDERIAVLGSEPQILFYAQRRSATPYIYVYPLVRPYPTAADMQRELIEDVERTRPPYVLLVNIEWSWTIHADAPREIFEWIPDYLPRHYRRAGILDLVSPTETLSLFGEQAQGYRPRSPYWIEVLVRNDLDQG